MNFGRAIGINPALTRHIQRGVPNLIRGVITEPHPSRISSVEVVQCRLRALAEGVVRGRIPLTHIGQRAVRLAQRAHKSPVGVALRVAGGVRVVLGDIDVDAVRRSRVLEGASFGSGGFMHDVAHIPREHLHLHHIPTVRIAVVQFVLDPHGFYHTVIASVISVRVRPALTEQVLGNREARGPVVRRASQGVNRSDGHGCCRAAEAHIVPEEVEQHIVRSNRVRREEAEDSAVRVVREVASAPL